MKVRQTLKALPSGSGLSTIEVAYDGAIERIDSQLTGQREIARKILTWISYAQRPLSISELQHALSVESDSTDIDEDSLLYEEDLTAHCAGLVIIDIKSKLVRFVHYTLQEYFKANKCAKLPDGDSILATTCLRYLIFEGISKILSTSRDFIYTDEESLSNEDDEIVVEDACSVLDRRESNDPEAYLPLKCKKQFPFTSYAIEEWQHHNLRSQEQGHANTFLIVNFLTLLQRSPHLAAIVFSSHMNGNWEGADCLNIYPVHTLPLMIASYCGFEQTCQILLDTDSNAVNAKSGRCASPLIHAIQGGHSTIVELLLSRGAKTDLPDSDGWLPQHHVASLGNVAMMVSLLACGIDINEQDSNIGQTALMVASETGSEPVVVLLLEEGADANVKDHRGMTALQYAQGKDDWGTIKVLLDAGASMDQSPSIFHPYLGSFPPEMVTMAGSQDPLTSTYLMAKSTKDTTVFDPTV